ncbi:MAG: DHH family phosphoesterase [Candidatus Peregrinibacteria bacterium]
MTGHLSFTGKKWVMNGSCGISPSLPVSTLPLAIARARGIAMDGALSLLPSPSILPDCEKAVERIRHSIDCKETVGVFGDYDCDGITATAQLVRFYRRYGGHAIVKLPHRVHDGYGLTVRAVEDFHTSGATLIITADCGITATHAAIQARELGIDLIITDHHHLPDTLPQAFAIVHPGLMSPSIDPLPSGAGVVHILLFALEGSSEWEGISEDRVLAMLGTVADLVELREGNRAIVQEGINAISMLPACPLKSLLLSAGLLNDSKPPTSRDIAFRVAPRINAAGRMDDATLALTAILDGGDALHKLEFLNSERQKSTVSLMDGVLKSLGITPGASDFASLPPLLSSVSADFPEGIVGLIAGKLTEMTGRPSFVGTLRGGLCTASLRSTPAYHVTEGLERLSASLLSFGGHAQAAGCSLPAERSGAFIEDLLTDVTDRVSPSDLVPVLSIDAEIRANDLSMKLLQSLSLLEPFGQGNPEPVFLLKNARLDSARCVGADATHLSGRIGGFKAIGWRLGRLLPHASEPLDVACRLETDTWNGAHAPQIVIEDLRPTTNLERVGQIKEEISANERH